MKTVIFNHTASKITIGNKDSQLFEDCPLDSVYIGRQLSYNTNSTYGYSPFYQNTTLRAVTYSSAETQIYDNEFSGCTNLQKLVVGTSVTSVGNSAFYKCSKLASVSLPPSVKTLGQKCFQYCKSLKNVNLGSVTTMGTYVFANCTSLPELSIPATTTGLPNHAFVSCTALKKFYIKDRTSTLSIGYGSSKDYPLFSDCPLDTVYIGGNISYNTTHGYGYSPFYSKNTLRSVRIGNNATSMPDNEFYLCTGLTNVWVGDGVTTISKWVCSGCSGLKLFSFGKAVTSIGENAFSDCTAMTQFTSGATTPPTCGTQALDDINKWNCTLTVPKGSLSKYQTANQWKEFLFAEEAVTTVSLAINKTTAKIQISGNLTLTCTVTPSTDATKGVTWTSSNTNVATVSSTGVVTPKAIGTVTITATSTFDTTKKVSCTVTITNQCVDGIYYTITDATNKKVAVTYATTDYNSYSGDVAIPEKVTIGGVEYSVTCIGRSAFASTTGLNSVSIPNTVTSINDQAFHTSSIKKICLPSSLSSIGSYVFAKCASLTDVYIQNGSKVNAGDGVLTLSANAKVHVYSNLKSAYQADAKWSAYTLTDDFDNPSAGSLSTIVGTNPTSLKVSGDLNGTDIKYLRSLINDHSLTSLDMSGANIVAGGEAYLGTSTTTANKVGNYMFSDCSNLSSIILPASTTSIGWHVFDNTSITTLTIPKATTELNMDIASGASKLVNYVVEDGNTNYVSVNGIVYDKEKKTLIAYPAGKAGAFEVPNNTTAIGTGAFRECAKLTSVTLPASITQIGRNGFSGCTGLTTVVCYATTAPSHSTTDQYANVTLSKVTLKVPYSSLSAYRTAAVWKDFGTITSIEGYAESVTLNKTTASILPHQTVTLTATTTEATPGVVWSTSDATIATVANGVVTAKKAGTVTITATANDGGKAKAICTVTVGTPAAPANVELVDLGLPSGTLWANMNVGATKAEGNGIWVAWGEVEAKASYTWATYKWANGSSTSLTKYCSSSTYGTIDNKKTLDPEDDAAYVNWGSDWRMPRSSELQELKNNCTFEKTKYNGSVVEKITGPNGNYIYVPVSGNKDGSTLYNSGTWGQLISSDISSSNNSQFVGLSITDQNIGGPSRYYGRQIRAVSATQKAIRVTGLELNKTTATIEMDATLTLTCTVAPTDASVKDIEWSSSNETVATVSASGVVTPRTSGDVTITATAKDGSGKTATCSITVKKATLTIADGTNYANTEDKQYDEITYTRSFTKANVWQAIYLPFSIDVEMYKTEFDIAEIFAFCPYLDTNGDGEVTPDDGDMLVVFKKSTGITSPNVPYLIRPKSVKTYNIKSADGMLYGATNGYVTCATTKRSFTITGLNTLTAATVENGLWYMSASGTISHRLTGSTNVKAFRWVMGIEDRTDNYFEAAPSTAKEFHVAVIGEDNFEETGIRDINSNDDNKDKIYLLNGIQINNSKQLNSGTYIINGKKIHVK